MNGQPTLDASKAKANGPALSDNYLPAVMQAVAYYVELLQYEVLDTTTAEPPFTTASSLHLMDPTTQKPMIPAGSSKIPVSTTPQTTTTTTPSTTTTPHPFAHTTPSHKPGNFAPMPAAAHQQPPPPPLHPPAIVQVSPAMHQMQSIPSAVEVVTEKPLTGPLALLSISTDQFFSWFLQMKEKQLSTESGR